MSIEHWIPKVNYHLQTYVHALLLLLISHSSRHCIRFACFCITKTMWMRLNAIVCREINWPHLMQYALRCAFRCALYSVFTHVCIHRICVVLLISGYDSWYDREKTLPHLCFSNRVRRCRCSCIYVHILIVFVYSICAWEPSLKISINTRSIACKHIYRRIHTASNVTTRTRESIAKRTHTPTYTHTYAINASFTPPPHPTPHHVISAFCCFFFLSIGRVWICANEP